MEYLIIAFCNIELNGKIMNNTLRNGIKVLEFLSSTGSSHSVKDIAGEMELPNSHACRLLKTLTETGYVEQDGKNKKYRRSRVFYQETRNT